MLSCPLHSNPWTSPALTDAMPWVHRGLSSGPCKPRRPLFTLQPNGYAKLPFMCHRHDRHKRPRLLSSRRRTQAFCSGTRELAWLPSLCSRRRLAHCHCGKRAITRDARLLSAPRWQLASCLHPTTKRECCICTVVSLQFCVCPGKGSKDRFRAAA